MHTVCICPIAYKDKLNSLSLFDWRVQKRLLTHTTVHTYNNLLHWCELPKTGPCHLHVQLIVSVSMVKTILVPCRKPA